MSAPRVSCPVCKGPAFEAEAETVRALVQDTLVDRIPNEVFQYCPSPTCDVVYSSGNIRFHRSDLRVRVGEKESTPPVQVCYCFDWTVGDIETEVERTGTTSIPDRIKSKIRAGLCHCETMNPRGVCCLGAVNRAVELATSRTKVSLNGPLPPAPAEAGSTTWFLAGGAVLMSVIASACCWLPLLLMGLGISAVGASTFFASYRPVLLPTTFLLLAGAWLFTYRAGLGLHTGKVAASPAPNTILGGST